MVSVIIPNYNHAPYLQQRIDSVLGQTFQDFEIIILDDCSTDNSRELIEKYRNHPKISHIVYNETNSGSTFKQWEKGINLAKGEWIWIAESDDWADAEFLTFTTAETKKENVRLVYCDSYSADENSKVKGVINWARQLDSQHWNKNFLNDGKDEIKNYLFWRNTIPNASAVLVEKNTLSNALKNNNFNFRYAGDWFFWIKCIETGNIAFVKKELNYFRQHTQSTRVAKNIKEERKRFKEYFTIINNIKIRYDLKLDEKKHGWIIYEWLYKKSDNNFINKLTPPLPLRYLYFYYKYLLIESIIPLFNKK